MAKRVSALCLRVAVLSLAPAAAIFPNESESQIKVVGISSRRSKLVNGAGGYAGLDPLRNRSRQAVPFRPLFCYSLLLIAAGINA